MPKERGDRSSSFDRLKLCTFLGNSSCSSLIEDEEKIKEWEYTQCPVCMEHPHNAILLICSSHEKGCHPFMCDTSYRHSNCFDQFLKSFVEVSDELPNSVAPIPTDTTVSEVVASDLGNEQSSEGLLSINPVPADNSVKPTIVCPLCRGVINGWTVMESARHFMNAKSRSCASETCDFGGTYDDMRKHARLVHPLVRPTVADPERQRKWRRLERQRDLGDLISTLESSLGEEITGERTITIDDGGWLAVFLVRSLRPQNSSRAHAQVGVRRRRPSRRLWGETIDGIIDSRDGEVESLDSENSPIVRLYARRRFGNQDNVNRESRDAEVETLGSDDDHTPISALLARRIISDRDNAARESRDIRAESDDHTPISTRYARRFVGDRNDVVHESRGAENGSSDGG